MPRHRSDIEPRLLEAAAVRFLVDGVDGASLRAIAKDAGTNIGMLYYYFPTKDVLFLAVVEHAYQRILQDLERILDPSHAFEDRLRGIFERIAALSDDEFRIVRIILREALVLSPRLEGLVARFSRGHVPLLISTLQDGLQTGRIDASLSLPVLLGALVGLAGTPQLAIRIARDRLPWLSAFLPTAPAMADICLQFYLRGIQGAPPSLPGPTDPT